MKAFVVDPVALCATNGAKTRPGEGGVSRTPVVVHFEAGGAPTYSLTALWLCVGGMTSVNLSLDFRLVNAGSEHTEKPMKSRKTAIGVSTTLDMAKRRSPQNRNATAPRRERQRASRAAHLSHTQFTRSARTNVPVATVSPKCRKWKICRPKKSQHRSRYRPHCGESVMTLVCWMRDFLSRAAQSYLPNQTNRFWNTARGPNVGVT